MKRVSFLFVLIILIVGGVAAWWINNLLPVDLSDQTKKTFEIKKGEGVREVANELKAEGLIKDPVVFFLLVKQMGLDGKIQAGEFYLSPSMSARKVAQSLLQGSYDLQITIPEGKRAEEVADILQGQLSSYQDSWRQRLVANEGYLFPDTYSFAKDADIDLIITTMRNNFDKKYATIPPNPNNTLSKEEIVNIASLVEREAKFPEDRPLVASVILNRLQEDMPLYLDATIQYALGYQAAEKSWWKKTLTDTDLEINSLYNTRERIGLPPTPISNPGLDVLNAVINAPKTDYLYYISDKSGHNHYTKTLEEHNINIEKYGL